MMRLILFLFPLLLPLVGFSAGKNSCICQIGLEPSYQRGFFERGCEKWLEEQTDCDSKKIIDQFQKNDELVLSEDSAGGLIKLGYVGHWASTVQSYNYFQLYLMPAMNKYHVGLYWDNTACKGLDRPEYFLKLLDRNRYIDKIAQERDILNNETDRQIAQIMKRPHIPKPVRPLPYWMTTTFVYKANQTISIGMWDRYVGSSSANFWAVINVTENKISLPACEDFQDKICHVGTQIGNTGRCLMPDGQEKNLVCCKFQSFSEQSSNFASWIEGKSCQ